MQLQCSALEGKSFAVVVSVDVDVDMGGMVGRMRCSDCLGID